MYVSTTRPMYVFTYLQACSSAQALSRQELSSRRYWVQQHCSGQARESLPGLPRKLRWKTCKPWSRRQTSACLAPWAPGVVVVSSSWEMEYCPLKQFEYADIQCCNGVSMLMLTFWVFGASTH